MVVVSRMRPGAAPVQWRTEPWLVRSAARSSSWWRGAADGGKVVMEAWRLERGAVDELTDSSAEGGGQVHEQSGVTEAGLLALTSLEVMVAMWSKRKMDR